MTPRLRKASLTVHVVSSVGWLGSVLVFLALAIVGLASDRPETARAAYLAMDLTTWLVIVPLAIAALLSGVIQSLGTSWGIRRHWWVLIKLLLTIFATALLLLHTQPVGVVAEAAERAALTANQLQATRVQLVADGAAAAVVLLIAAVLSVFKPRGLTKYGWRTQQSLVDPSRL